jgi:hypothetical protein
MQIEEIAFGDRSAAAIPKINNATLTKIIDQAVIIHLIRAALYLGAKGISKVALLRTTIATTA